MLLSDLIYPAIIAASIAFIFISGWLYSGYVCRNSEKNIRS
jgi:hypothetical protein